MIYNYLRYGLRQQRLTLCPILVRENPKIGHFVIMVDISTSLRYRAGGLTKDSQTNGHKTSIRRGCPEYVRVSQ